MDAASMTKAELLKRMEETFNTYQENIPRNAEEQLTSLTDAAGWTIKDHLYHLALSEGSMVAMLDRRPIYEAMGVDEATWRKGDDPVNAVVQQRTRDLPLSEVLNTLRENHQRLVERLQTVSDEELQLPYREYQPHTDNNEPIMQALVNNTFHHYEEHFPWIVDILNSARARMSKDELLRRMEEGWQYTNTYLNSLTENQLTEPTDEAGWTVKDHAIHMATWEGSVLGMLDGTPRWETMGMDKETWKQGDDAINAVIQKRYRDLSLAEVLKTFRETHERLMAKIQSMSDEDLHRPYNYYQKESKQERPIILWIQGNTFQHYEDHQPWMAKIVEDNRRY